MEMRGYAGLIFLQPAVPLQGRTFRATRTGNREEECRCTEWKATAQARDWTRNDGQPPACAAAWNGGDRK